MNADFVGNSENASKKNMCVSPKGWCAGRNPTLGLSNFCLVLFCCF